MPARTVEGLHLLEVQFASLGQFCSRPDFTKFVNDSLCSTTSYRLGEQSLNECLATGIKEMFRTADVLSGRFADLLADEMERMMRTFL